MDTRKNSRISGNLIGIVILAGAFLASLVAQLRGPQEAAAGQDDGQRVLRFLHWQLEPGFREALQESIDTYNSLPHVRAAGYRVEQIAINERVYTQFLNVHLISGTAPDLIAQNRKSLLVTAPIYFEPVDGLIAGPNPYNARANLPADLDPGLAGFMATAPWRETITDRMDSGYVPTLGSYYAVPVASWGSIRLLYNRTIIREAKNLVRDVLGSGEALPDWTRGVLSEGPVRTGDTFLVATADLADWAASDDPPDTFGRLILLCEAINELARRSGREKLVPIAGSNYSQYMFANAYGSVFTYAYEKALDLDLDGAYTPTEVFAGWQNGRWSFDDDKVRAGYSMMRDLAGYFPVGFLGLDREQANRRFILGNAAMLATGAWDAPGVYRGAQSHADPADRFEVGVAGFPIPAPGERYSEYEPLPKAEGDGSVGVPMALNKASPMRDEAVDFLQFITSFVENQRFVQSAGFLPVVMGGDIAENMRGFQGNFEGVPGDYNIAFESANLRTVWEGQYHLYLSGEQSYEGFQETVVDTITDPVVGMNRQWFQINRSRMDTSLAAQRSLNVQRFRELLGTTGRETEKQYQRVLHRSAMSLSGREIERRWQRQFPNEPFPEF